jgi:hypothetical protein
LQNPPRKFKTSQFGASYKGDLFLFWWKNQKPSAQRLHRMIPQEWGDRKPSVLTLHAWIKDDFDHRANVLDKRLADEIEGRLIKEKVEMLYRHAQIGREAQDKALAKIRSVSVEDLPVSSAIRLFVEGVRIERESVGLPQALEKMINKSDDEILNRIKEITEESEAEILIIDDAD